MKNHFSAFTISLFIHSLVIVGLILGSAQLKTKRAETVVLDLSMILMDKPEEPAPAPPQKTETPEVKPVKPVVKPKPKTPPVVKPKPKVEEKRPVEEVAAVTIPIAPVSDETAETDANAESYEEYDGDDTGDADATASVSAGGSGSGEALRAAYVGKNFAYIQKRVARYTVYPSRAKRTGIKGKLTVAFTINLDGTVSDIFITESSGHTLLDDAGIAAVKDASPFPSPPVAARIAIPISFKLM
jgi:protein TonB